MGMNRSGACDACGLRWRERVPGELCPVCTRKSRTDALESQLAEAIRERDQAIRMRDELQDCADTARRKLAEAERTIEELRGQLETEQAAFRVAHGMNEHYRAERDEARLVAVWAVRGATATYNDIDGIDLMWPNIDIDFSVDDDVLYRALREAMGGER